MDTPVLKKEGCVTIIDLISILYMVAISGSRRHSFGGRCQCNHIQIHTLRPRKKSLIHKHSNVLEKKKFRII